VDDIKVRGLGWVDNIRREDERMPKQGS